MASRVRRHRSLLSEVRATLIRAGTAAGLLGGVWYGIDHPGTLRQCAAAAAGRRADSLLDRCIDQGAAAVAWHWALVLGAGMLAGLAAGALLSMLLLAPRVPAGTLRDGLRRSR